jgi:MFS family permease
MNISDLTEDTINIAKYSDLVIYFPANFFSVYLIERFGLRVCICLGSIIMLVGTSLRFLSIFENMYFWYFGHIICMTSGAFLKNPVTKLASNWFGDKERALATSIGVVAQPLGLFISQIMIITIFDNEDKQPYS